ncbi:MAG: hypothetical protein IJT96_01080 [Lachnospiraceae bacterium]|nr:hypothetical protein [Lachnospiraceae bacterium]
MVFKRESLNGTGEIVVYSNYHKYWLDRERKIKNPLFDVFSGRILDLKDGKENAIQYFYDILDREICEDVAICVVPSSNADNKDSGIVKLGKKLAENGRRDRVYFLTREKSVSKLATGGNRSKEVHLESIGTLEDMSVEDEIVLLMDDVTTTGNSLYACKEILIRSGAKEVEMFALGKAI